MKSRDTNQTNYSWQILAYIVMIIFTILTIGPLLWLFYSSFKPHAAIVHNIFALPKSFYLNNYIEAWRLGHMGVLVLNSIFYSTVATVLTTFLALAAGYGFAKFNYRISNFLYFFFIMGLLITVHSVLVPLFVMETRIHIDNTRTGVILPYIAFGLPFLIYLATSYIKGIPDSLEEAAIIDGASYLSFFWNILIPIVSPVVATMIIFSFLANWNEFVFVLTLTSKETLRSLPVGVNAFAGGRTRNYGLQFAALVIATLPMIVFYIFFHSQLARGFAAGALKE
ncbi:MAG: carbohydrate ABC transporter permease [Spirochaetales bacterium]|nr:carbohydrate ABC transporter permease [Spirochaetales bacterium]